MKKSGFYEVEVKYDQKVIGVQNVSYEQNNIDLFVGFQYQLNVNTI